MFLLKQAIGPKNIMKGIKVLYKFRTTHKVWEIKNNSMMIVEDKLGVLPYMA